MNLVDAVKFIVSDWQTRAEIRQTRRAWAKSDVHKFRSLGIEMLARVAGEIKEMDDRLARLRAGGQSRR